MFSKISSINFKGAFLVKSPSQKVKDELPSVIGTKKQIFNDFNENGDVFYVMRPSGDARVLEYLDNNKIDYKYYPYLDTKCRFDDEKPEQAKEIIAKAEKEYEESVPKNKLKEKSKNTTVVSLEYVKNAINTLDLENNKVVNVKKKYYRNVIDKNNKVLASISPVGKFGLCYVVVEPKHSADNRRFLALNTNGQIVHEFKGLDGVRQFGICFNNSIKFYKEQLVANNK